MFGMLRKAVKWDATMTKMSPTYRGVVSAVVAGGVMWGGFFYAWHEGYIPERWKPTELTVCLAGTMFFPGCWVSYALKRVRGE